jgi:hypothetical protein
MMTIIPLALSLSLLMPAAGAPPKTKAPASRPASAANAYRKAADTVITPDAARDYLMFIASDALQGRDTPSPGLDAAAEFLAFNMKKWGVKPGGDKGTFFQDIFLTRARLDKEKTMASVDGRVLKYTDDFVAAQTSAGTFNRGDAKGMMVYVGHGWQWKSKGVDPYEGLDVKGKVLVVSTAMPPDMPWKDGKSGVDYLPPAVVAQKLGAVGILILTSGDDASWKQKVRQFEQTNNRANFARIQDPAEVVPAVPTIAISPAVSASLVNGEGMDLPTATDSKASKGKAFAPAKLAQFTVTRDISRQRTQNVVGIIEGIDPKLKAEYVAIGAHYDHVGIRTNALEGTDRIFNGADDDGSGTTGVLQVAEAFAKGPKPKRSLIFVWHCGEEKGLWGSEFFADHPTVPIESIVAQLNIDMIGRSKKAGDQDRRNADLSGPNGIYVIGSRMLSSELGKVSDSVNAGYLKLNFDFRYDAPDDPNRFYYRSDHYNYAKKGIPIIFYFDGVHEDYHQVGDEPQKIDYEKLSKVARTVHATAVAVGNAPVRPKVDGKARD